MSQEIKLSSEELKLISLFQKITRATARDVITDEKLDRLIFVVNEGKMGLAIGKGGANIKNLQNIIKKPVELVEYASEPEAFLKKMLNPKFILDVKFSERLDGSTQAEVTVDAAKKGVVVGKEGRHAEKARLLGRRYFNITKILINSPQAMAMEW
tara:strand:+ start:4818 stop:5282 length:465 start_codon:yes stop_codon:yes gene_type:complete